MAMTTLKDFYHTESWKNFARQIKLERTNEDGQIICEYCNKPILNSYDCIAHHCNTFLTEENVNDAEIAFNPENIQLVHHRCHNLIHEKFGCKRREVYLIYGSPCSGKSTYLDSVRRRGDFIVDIDRIRQCISGEPTHIVVPVLNQMVFGIRDYLMDSVRYRRGKWQRCYIIGGFPLQSERERICDETGAIEIYIESTKEECLDRLEKNPNGRDKESWKKFIDEWWSRYTLDFSR